jgi:hypothetical protein
MASWTKGRKPKERFEGGREEGSMDKVEEETPGLWKVPEVMREWST